jgi:hypothetical protein
MPKFEKSLDSRDKPAIDAYFSADVETDGPIPGPFSMLSFALVYAGRFDGSEFQKPKSFDQSTYRELKPISPQFQDEALAVNGLDRSRLLTEGGEPSEVMTEAADWVTRVARDARPVLVAYPLSFDWSWLYWYFVKFSATGSPFGYSRCFDLKTAVAVKNRIPISGAGRERLDVSLRADSPHTHHALDDAVAQAEIFSKVFAWEGKNDRAGVELQATRIR